MTASVDSGWSRKKRECVSHSSFASFRLAELQLTLEAFALLDRGEKVGIHLGVLSVERFLAVERCNGCHFISRKSYS